LEIGNFDICIMLFSYEWLQSFFNKKLPSPRELAELILARGFEVEKIDALGKDWVLDINILSNRPDCLSHLGMAREIGAFLGITPNFIKFKAAQNQIKRRPSPLLPLRCAIPKRARATRRWRWREQRLNRLRHGWSAGWRLAVCARSTAWWTRRTTRCWKPASLCTLLIGTSWRPAAAKPKNCRAGGASAGTLKLWTARIQSATVDGGDCR